MLCCDRCNEWTCSDWAGVNEDQYRFPTGRDDFPFFCDKCKLPAMTAIFPDAYIEAKCKRYCEIIENRVKTV
jgi:hypothetical protein